MTDSKKRNSPLSMDELEERVNMLGRAVLGSPTFGKAMNTAIETQGALQRGWSKSMAKRLHFYNVPTQDDMISLAQQCARLEERMVRIETLLVQALSERKAEADGAKTAGPPRTRKPAAKRKAAKKPAPRAPKKT